MFKSIKDKLPSLILEYKNGPNLNGSDVKEVLVKFLSYWSKFRFIKDVILIVLGFFGIMLPYLTLQEMTKNNEIMLKQTNWIIENSLDEKYHKYMNILHSPSHFNLQQKQFALDSLIELSLRGNKYSLSNLDLSGLKLDQYASTVTIRNVKFNETLSKWTDLRSYKIYGSLFNNLEFGKKEYNYYHHIFKDIEIKNSKIKNSHFTGVSVVSSKIGAHFEDSSFSESRFCGVSIDLKMKNSTISDSIFNCNDDFIEIYTLPIFQFIFPQLTTNLKFSDFEGATLKNVDFSYADLSNVRNLDKANVEGVCGNEKTVWPTYISFPNCNENTKPQDTTPESPLPTKIPSPT